jgi:hypothetical protein
MDDQSKVSVLRALKSGQHTENQILQEAHISKGTLRALLSEYEIIKEQIEEMKTLQEISTDLGLSQDYLEKVRYIIETDSEKLNEEMGIKADTNLDTDALPQEQEEPVDEGEPELEEKPKTKPKVKGGKGKDSTKNIEQKMEKSGEGETADVLLKDAGEIAKSLAIERQEIGKLVQEYVGTIAAQYGYTNYQVFLEHLLNFWIENQGKIREMEEEIAQLNELVNQQNEILDIGIVQGMIIKSLEKITYAALIGGTIMDERFMDILEAYKHVMITDPTIIKKLMNDQQQLHLQLQKQNQNNNIPDITEMN